MTVRRTFHLGAPDLKATRDFYVQILGCTCTTQNDKEVWLEGWGTTVVLHKGQGRNHIHPTSRSRANAEFIVPLERLESVWSALRQDEPDAKGPQLEGQMMNYVVLDPAGNAVSLITPMPMAEEGDGALEKTTRRLKPIE